MKVVRVERFSRESIGSSEKMGLKFHKHTPAYVATGGTSKCRQICKKGIDKGCGTFYAMVSSFVGSSRDLLTSSGRSPPHMYACVMNARIIYALRHSARSCRLEVERMGNRFTTSRSLLLNTRACRFAATASHLV